MAPQDTRKAMDRRWDAYVGITDGFVTTPNHHLNAGTLAGTITLAAPGAGVCNAIQSIEFSYFGTVLPTHLAGGNVIVRYGGTVAWQVTVGTIGAYQYEWNPPRLAPPNAAVEVIMQPIAATAITGRCTVTAGTVIPYPYFT